MKLSSLYKAYAILLLGVFSVTFQAYALTEIDMQRFAQAENSDRAEMIKLWASKADADALPIMQAINEESLQQTPAGTLLIVKEGQAFSALGLKPLGVPPVDAEAVMINTLVRAAVEDAEALLKIAAPVAKDRLAAITALQERVEDSLLPILTARLQVETDAEVKEALQTSIASLSLQNTDTAVRLRAAEKLGESGRPEIKALLEARLQEGGESDTTVRAMIQASIKSIDSRLFSADLFANVFTGVSLASILLLAALGLAITYGLLGVINMAHGEMIMLGAYTTYLTQSFFKLNLSPSSFDYYLLAALPLAFILPAIVGMLIERLVIRHLYGRPLETLLATWGLSLILMQAVRMIFGAQNVEVANPAWMSGGWNAFANVVLPYSRMVIIGFALAVLVSVWFILNKTRLGLFVRATTQNRKMAQCMGVRTWKIDTMSFGLGSGIAGLAGCALSQIGNVGPDLGQSYVVDSFMVVVVGGVGQLIGTVYAALGLGVASKVLEAQMGAVLAKILLLAIIVLFIQKRPQGLFAFKGRSTD